MVNVDINYGMDRIQFNSLAPTLLQQVSTGVCAYLDNPTPELLVNTERSKVWGYGTLSVLIIGVIAVLVALVVPRFSDSVYEAVTHTMIGLAVATLTGDAVLHLIPEAVELHAHNPFGHEHTSTGHTHAVDELDYVWKFLVVEAALYVFFVFQRISSIMSCTSDPQSTTSDGPVEMDNLNSASAYRNSVSESKKTLTDAEGGAAVVEEGYWKGCGRVSIMIILENCLHNIAEGLAIGAAFTVSVPTGISTSIAVLCRQLPHELGDLAAMLNQGMQLCSAVFLHLIAACLTFLGLWIGIALAETDTGREWIFAAAAGMFLYVALVNMLPLLHSYKGRSHCVIFFMQNVGFLVGIAIILAIAIAEDLNNLLF